MTPIFFEDCEPNSWFFYELDFRELDQFAPYSLLNKSQTCGVNVVNSIGNPDKLDIPDKELNMINNEQQSVNNKESDKLWHLDHQGNVDYAKLMEDFRASVASYYARTFTDSRPQPN